MADPLSIASSVITLLSSAYHLCAVTLQSVEAIRSAPLHISRVTADLRAFCHLLTTLKALLDDPETARGVLHPASSSATDMELVVRDCHGILEEIAEALRPYGRLYANERGGSARRDDKEKGKMAIEWRMKKWQGIRWGLCGEKELERLRAHLAAHKMTLSLTIAAANLINTTSTNCSTQRLEDEVRCLKRSLTDLLERVESAPTSSSLQFNGLEVLEAPFWQGQSCDVQNAGLLQAPTHNSPQPSPEGSGEAGSNSNRSSSSYATARSSLLEELLDEVLCEPSSPPQVYISSEGNISQTTLIGSTFTTDTEISLPASAFSVGTCLTLVDEGEEQSLEQEKELEIWEETPAELLESRCSDEKGARSKFSLPFLKVKASSKIRSNWNWRLRGHSGSAGVVA